MTSDLFNYFNGKYIDPTYRSSSAARARLKAWDQKHEYQPSWEEDFYDYESSEQVWDEVTCGQSVMGVDDCGILPEEKWEYIKNPSLSTKEIWQLFADESADERADRYGHRYDDIESVGTTTPMTTTTTTTTTTTMTTTLRRQLNRPLAGADRWFREGFFLHELEKESESISNYCEVWSEPCKRSHGLRNHATRPNLNPPLISDHHYRKAA